MRNPDTTAPMAIASAVVKAARGARSRFAAAT